MMHKFLLIIGLLTGTALAAYAQKPDTVAVKSDVEVRNRKTDSLESKRFVPKMKSEKIYHPDSTHSPHKAVVLALVLPGSGQYYNRKYWKMPLIYGGLYGIMAAILFNAKYYNDFLRVAVLQNEGATLAKLAKSAGTDSRDYRLFESYGSNSAASIVAAKDGYRRYRDISILGFLAAWGIQAVDAYIDAKFIHSYSMDNNLTFKVTPSVINPGQPVYASATGINTNFVPSLKLIITLK